MIVVDTSVLIDFFDGKIEDPYSLIRPYRILLISPVALHEVLRVYPEDRHQKLIGILRAELLPVPALEDWIIAAKLLRKLYPLKKDRNLIQMQNDILIALSAQKKKIPVWSRDADFKSICSHLHVHLLQI